MILKIAKKKFNLKDRAFVIAEIGHNHKGSLQIAKDLIKAAKKDAGADAVKFQKRNNKELYTKKCLTNHMITLIVMEKLMDCIVRLFRV